MKDKTVFFRKAPNVDAWGIASAFRVVFSGIFMSTGNSRLVRRSFVA